MKELITQITDILPVILTKGFGYLKYYYPRPFSIYQCAGIDTITFILLVVIFGITINLLTKFIVIILSKLLGVKFAFIFSNYLTWPGVVHHELSHALIAFLTGAIVKKIVVFPKGDSLGHINFIPRGNIFFRSIQTSLTAIAPPALGIVSLFLISIYVFPNCKVWWDYLLTGYVFISIALHMKLSKKNCKNSW